MARAQESTAVSETELSYATFAGGCFWCMEGPFDKLDGVVSTISGYAGGDLRNPTYEQVSTGRTGHTEVVRVVYDPAVVSLHDLAAQIEPQATAASIGIGAVETIELMGQRLFGKSGTTIQHLQAQVTV